MPTVKLMQMGPLPTDLNLRDVVKLANAAQRHFQFELGDPITGLGAPGEDGVYSFSALAPLLEARRKRDNVDTAIGVIDCPLVDELFSGLDTASKNVVISLSPARPLLAHVNQTKSAYVLVEVAAQLLTIEYRQQTGTSAAPEQCAPPWHQETRSCLFDYCADAPQTLKKLMSPKLCSGCTALLESANIEASVIRSCVTLVETALRQRFWNVLRSTLGDPIGRFAFGGLVTLLATEGGTAIGFTKLDVGGVLSVAMLVVLLCQMRRANSRVR